MLFELGVRLTVRPDGTHCLLDETADQAGAVPPSEELKKFLSPFRYRKTTLNFAPAFDKQGAGAGLIYRTAADHFRTEQDRYDEMVDGALTAAATATRGPGYNPENVDIRPLFGQANDAYGNVILESALEKLCAAWCYLAEREAPHELRPIDLLDPRGAESFGRFFRLGAGLKSLLASQHRPRDERMRARIAAAERTAEESQAAQMADLLEVWNGVRKRPPWIIEDSKVSAMDCEDWADDAGQLKTLEKVLSDMGSPVCEVALQGVRSDRKRVERAVVRFREKLQ